ncbi:GNAT family N-acetyltransferase [Clostridium transplantifaecale]|uniref:GNAT family N-acetyltransferase n=1 Tax=Clostridium transplantifaecale TaxID=2479838 RepID=UPI000F62D0DD|nr:GNAT family N-acetyltransferase [Clostridium transplantifaecale]
MEYQNTVHFRITDKIEEHDRAEIYAGLLEYNMERLEDKNPREVGIFLEDAEGKKTAGLIGETHGNWLMIKFLWVDTLLRGQNIGRRLLNQAEDTARERGCKYVFLDTFSFQAPDFYKKLGYEEVFLLENYPLTGKRHYFTKNLL